VAEIDYHKAALKAVKIAEKNNSLLVDELTPKFVEGHKERLQDLMLLSENKSALTPKIRGELEKYFGTTIEEIHRRIKATDEGVDEKDIDTAEKPSEDAALIQFTTYNGCKGLSAGHVFIIGLEQGVFPRKADPSDNEICQLIVGLTRTRKECHLINVKNFSGKWNQPSVFLKMLPKESVSNISVDKTSFK